MPPAVSVRNTTTARFLLFPASSIAVNIGLAAFLSNLYSWQSSTDEAVREWRDIGISMSGLLANASIAIVTLTFSLTVLSIQIAAQTYSPRLLDDFLRDPISQIAVSVNMGAYAYSFCLQYWLYNDDTTSGVPIVAINVLTVHMIVVLLMFVVFIHYFINGFRLESILHRATEASWTAAQKLELALKLQTGLVKDDDDLPTVPTAAYKVLADHSGYLSHYNLDRVLKDVTKLDLCVRYHPNIGEFIAEGSLVAYVWDHEIEEVNNSAKESVSLRTTQQKSLSFQQRVLMKSRRYVDIDDDDDIDNDDATILTKKGTTFTTAITTADALLVEEILGGIIANGLVITTARSGSLDVLLGVQQLTDVAVRALSAAVNDPMTAIQALDYLSTLFGRLARLQFPIGCARDKHGVVRITSPRRSFAYLLSILDAIRFYGCADLQVTYRLIRFYGDLGATLKRIGNQSPDESHQLCARRIPAILAQMEQCMRVCRKNFDADSTEMKSIQELYEYSMALIVTSSEGPRMQQNEEIEKDLTELETTFTEPTSRFFREMSDNYREALDDSITTADATLTQGTSTSS